MIRAIATKKSFVNAKMVGASMSTLVPRPTFKPKYDNYINGKVGIVCIRVGVSRKRFESSR
jgi:hypothetical protein